jgi:hypothetical protein
LHHIRFVLLRNGDGVSDLENLIADRDLIAVAESNRVMNSPLVQKRSVAAAEINEPKLANILQMNQRMPARHFWRLQHNCASTASSYGTTTFDRMASAIGCFQPGTFIWGHAHTEALSNVTADGKYLPSIPDS